MTAKGLLHSTIIQEHTNYELTEMGEYAIASIKTSDGQTADFMRHHLELVINSYTFFLFCFLHKKPTWKRIDEECCCGAS